MSSKSKVTEIKLTHTSEIGNWIGIVSWNFLSTMWFVLLSLLLHQDPIFKDHIWYPELSREELAVKLKNWVPSQRLVTSCECLTLLLVMISVVGNLILHPNVNDLNVFNSMFIFYTVNLCKMQLFWCSVVPSVTSRWKYF